MNLFVKYMGLNLKNPLMVSASSITNSLNNIIKCEEEGVGAVVLKSLFEEEINADINAQLDMDDMYFWYPGAADKIRDISKEQGTQPYLKLIEKAKNQVSIPVIASVNCISASDWVNFSRNIQDAGADALELNVSTILPYKGETDPRKVEETIIEIVQRVKEQLNIPVAVKINPYFSNLIGMADKLEGAGANGLVIFNRFYRPDIDIVNLNVISHNSFSGPEEISQSLRWVGILSQHVSCDLAASTGIHGYEGVVKQILAGATVTQMCSSLYLRGLNHISQTLEDLKWWMETQKFSTIDDFRGKITDEKLNAAEFERIHFVDKNTRTL